MFNFCWFTHRMIDFNLIGIFSKIKWKKIGDTIDSLASEKFKRRQFTLLTLIYFNRVYSRATKIHVHRFIRYSRYPLIHCEESTLITTKYHESSNWKSHKKSWSESKKLKKKIKSTNASKTMKLWDENWLKIFRNCLFNRWSVKWLTKISENKKMHIIWLLFYIIHNIKIY